MEGKPYNESELDHLRGQVRVLSLALAHLLKGGGSATPLFDLSLELEERLESVDDGFPTGSDAYLEGMYDTLTDIDGLIGKLRSG